MLTQNYSQHTRPNTTNSNQNNSSITSPGNEQTANFLLNSDSTIVLQTTSVCVMNTPEDQFCVIVLFDTGSQQTFISDRLVKELKLAPLGQIDMKVSVFLNTDYNMKLSE